MDQNNKLITPENSTSWLASCGFIFPTNETELHRFNILHGRISDEISGEEVNPLKILRKVDAEKKRATVIPIRGTKKYKLVAHQLKALPPHISQKWKNNKG